MASLAALLLQCLLWHCYKFQPSFFKLGLQAVGCVIKTIPISYRKVCDEGFLDFLENSFWEKNVRCSRVHDCLVIIELQVEREREPVGHEYTYILVEPLVNHMEKVNGVHEYHHH